MKAVSLELKTKIVRLECGCSEEVPVCRWCGEVCSHCRRVIPENHRAIHRQIPGVNTFTFTGALS